MSIITNDQSYHFFQSLLWLVPTQLFSSHSRELKHRVVFLLLVFQCFKQVTLYNNRYLKLGIGQQMKVQRRNKTLGVKIELNIHGVLEEIADPRKADPDALDLRLQNSYLDCRYAARETSWGKLIDKNKKSDWVWRCPRTNDTYIKLHMKGTLRAISYHCQSKK